MGVDQTLVRVCFAFLGTAQPLRYRLPSLPRACLCVPVRACACLCVPVRGVVDVMGVMCGV